MLDRAHASRGFIGGQQAVPRVLGYASSSSSSSVSKVSALAYTAGKDILCFPRAKDQHRLPSPSWHPSHLTRCVTTQSVADAARVPAAPTSQTTQGGAVLLVDGHSLAHRAMHAMSKAPLSTKTGVPTSLTSNFLSMLQATIKVRKPSAVVVAFDSGRSFRKPMALYLTHLAANLPPGWNDEELIKLCKVMEENVRMTQSTVTAEELPQLLISDLDEERQASLRHSLETESSSYKAGRAVTPPEFYQDLHNLKLVLQALRIPMESPAGVEADDTLAALALDASSKGHAVDILTGDKDMFQLVNNEKKIFVLYPNHDRFGPHQVMGENEVAKKMDVQLLPWQLPEFRALVGDFSDNIPGVAGIGVKTAATLFEHTSTLEDLYASLDSVDCSVKPRVVAYLRAGRTAAFVSRFLSTLAPGLVTLDPGRTYQMQGFRRADVVPLLDQLELSERLRGLAAFQATLGGEVADQPPLDLKPLNLDPAPGGRSPIAHPGPASQLVAALKRGAAGVSPEPEAQASGEPRDGGVLPVQLPPTWLSHLQLTRVHTAEQLQTVIQSVLADLTVDNGQEQPTLALSYVEVTPPPPAPLPLPVLPKVKVPKVPKVTKHLNLIPTIIHTHAAARHESAPPPAELAPAPPSPFPTPSIPPVPLVEQHSLTLAWRRPGGAEGETSIGLQVAHLDLGGLPPEESRAWLQGVWQLLSDPRVHKAVHNSKQWHRLGLELGLGPSGQGLPAHAPAQTSKQGSDVFKASWQLGCCSGVGAPLTDTLLTAFAVNPDWKDLGRQATVAEKYALLQPCAQLEKLVVMEPSKPEDPLDPRACDAVAQAAVAAQLWALQRELGLMAQPGREMELPPAAWSFLSGVELPLQEVLASMEQTGMGVDAARLQALKSQLVADEAQVLAECRELADIPTLKPNSGSQLNAIFFQPPPHGLGLPTTGLKQIKTGWSLDATVLDQLAELHPLPAKVKEYRQLAKLSSTFVSPLLAAAGSSVDGRIHTHFDPAGAATGRLSCSDPNLQNLPTADGGPKLDAVAARLDAYNHIVRLAMVPQPGWTLLAADYSQVELRILAALAQEPVLVQAFAEGRDVHRATASQLLGKPVEQVTPADRKIGKVINFGVIYGMGAQKLAADVGCSPAEAKTFIEKYHERYARVAAFMERTRCQAICQGYVDTLMGRRRVFNFSTPSLTALRQTDPNKLKAVPKIEGFTMMADHAKLRAAGNAPVQGTGADLLKTALVRVAAALHTQGLRARVLMTVHDEMVLEVPPEELEVVQQLVVACMEGAADGRLGGVPLVVEVAAGSSWAEV